MKIDILSAGKWFRYLGTPGVSFDGKSSKIVLGGREIYGLVAYNSKFLLVDKEMISTVSISQDQAAQLVKQSKPYLGKIQGKDIEPGSDSLESSFPDQGNNKTSPLKTQIEKPEVITPKIPNSSSIKLINIAKPRRFSYGTLVPCSQGLENQIEKSVAKLGTKIKFKRSIKIANASDIGSCIIHSFNKRSGLYDVYIGINPRQLTQLFGSVNTDSLAQVITHELAHYAIKNILKNSDVLKFKKQIAAKQLHKDQFNHPGYSNPWWDEAFAILCEAMVHGRSCRGFTTPIGWEIAEKYFVNRYLADGVYTGSYESA